MKIEEYNLLVPGAEFSLVRYKLKVEKYDLVVPGYIN
jgi:hypothetical protein